ncbi:MAG: hypothetical protein EBX90_14635, partial [Betaproteobacteria bacterium]|nr:hypothetical protein [Betaproteobacteria bacterium]
MSQFLIDQFLGHKIDSLSVLHTRFVNTLVQKPEKNDLLPIGRLQKLEAGTGERKAEALTAEESLQYIYEPNAEGVLTSLLWKSNLPVSWPWQAIVRLRIPGTLTNGLASPFLGIFPAQNSYSTNFYDLYAEGSLLSSASGVLPGAVYAGSLTS